MNVWNLPFGGSDRIPGADYLFRFSGCESWSKLRGEKRCLSPILPQIGVAALLRAYSFRSYSTQEAWLDSANKGRRSR
jgi:hypothetical protein